MTITVTLLHTSHYTDTDFVKQVKWDGDEDEGHEVGRGDGGSCYLFVSIHFEISQVSETIPNK